MVDGAVITRQLERFDSDW